MRGVSSISTLLVDAETCENNRQALGIAWVWKGDSSMKGTLCTFAALNRKVRSAENGYVGVGGGR